MSVSPKPQVEKLKPCYHGGPNYAELRKLGISPDTVMDFSVSSNPYPAPVELKNALCSLVIDRYPDSDSAELKEYLAGRLSLKPENLIMGNGSMEIIRLVAGAYFGVGDTVLILKPTFGEYELAAEVAGADIIEQWADEESGFKFDLDVTCRLIKKHQPKAVFICNPNNPTGVYLSKADIEKVLSVCTDTLLVLDEAYIAFAEGGWKSIDLLETGNIIVIRSMTKDCALAGLRLGYGMASAEIITNLKKVCPPWNVNAAAQKAGLVCLCHPRYLAESEKKIKASKEYLRRGFAGLGFRVLPSETNFFLLKVKKAADFRSALLKHGLMVRDCTSFGLPQYVRIAPRTQSECERLLAVAAELKSKSEIYPA